MKTPIEETTSTLNRRSIIAGGPSLLMVGALAAPAILSPGAAHAVNAHNTMRIYWGDYHTTSLNHTSPSYRSARLDLTQFQRNFNGGNESHTVFARYQGHHNFSLLMNYEVYASGSRYRSPACQFLPSSITSMNSIPASYERAHPSRLGRRLMTNAERDLRGTSGSPGGMRNVTFLRRVATTRDNQTWIRQYRHNSTQNSFYLLSNHYGAGRQHEWRYLISNDLSSSVATRFYAMKDAERSLTTANMELGGAIFGGALASTAAIVAEFGTAGASTAPSTAAIIGSVAAVGAAGANRENVIEALMETHDRYDSSFERAYSLSNTSGYLTKNSSINDFNDEFRALGIM